MSDLLADLSNVQATGLSSAEIDGLSSQSLLAQAGISDLLDTTASATTTVQPTLSGEMLDVDLEYSRAIIASENAALNLAAGRGTSPTPNIQTSVSNPLHDYESYTYGISLHMVGIDYFNQLIVDNNAANYVPQNVLVASAGKYGVTFNRNPYFTEDFYFDDLKFKTYVNVSTRNRNSNLLEIDFSIIEPLGFTFINRLLLAANEVNNGNGNYIHMPYLLQIDFYGYKDGQLSQIKDQTKRIPIRLITCKSKVTTKGTEYNISAIPFNHQAFNQAMVVTPISVTVTGKTVKDIFGSGELDKTFASTLAERSNLISESKSITQRLESLRESASELIVTDLNNQLIDIKNRLNSNYNNISTKGFTDALNTHLESVKFQNKLQLRNIIRVEFDPDIGKSPLFKGGYVNVASTPGTSNSKNDIQQAAGQAKGQLTFDGTTANIPAGTKIDQLIDWAVRNSEYIKDQILDPTLKGKNPQELFAQVLNWYRIIPRINKILGFNSQTNTYALDITYVVKKFKMASKYPYGPKARVPGFVKKYDYIYTGKNKDVLDASLDFDMLYLVELSSLRTKHNLNETAKALASGPAANPDVAAAENTSANNTNDADKTNESPVSLHFTADNVQAQDATGATRQKQVAAADLARSLTLGARGDMINIKLRILGDPHFIKQDDLFYGQTYLDAPGQFTENNSLWMDRGELYVFLNFESPVDYNEQKGFADVRNSPYRYSEFNGVYKIIHIDNIFSRGKFEQTLDLVKVLYDQDGKTLLSNSTTQREESAAQNVLGSLQPNQYTRFSGPTINLGGVLNSSNPVVNTTVALAAAAGGTSALATLGGSVLNQGLQMVQGRITQEISKAINPIIDEAIAGVKDFVSDAILEIELSLVQDIDFSTFDGVI